MSDVAYFDNAATTFPKPECVYDFADSFYRSSGGNIGRGGNALAVAAGDIARKVKDNLRKLYAAQQARSCSPRLQPMPSTGYFLG